MHYDFLIHFVLPIAGGMLLFVAAFFIGCFEKRSVRQFEAADVQISSPYMAEIVQRAIDLGFVYRSIGSHLKYREKVIGVLLLSPDRSSLVLCGAGTIASLRSKQTTLFSRFRDGSILMTVDELGTAELDEKTKRQLLHKANFDELWEKHRQALSDRADLVLFVEESDWSTIDEIYRQRVDRIVNRGLATYVYSDQELYRYTLRGSFMATLVHGIRQSFTPKNIGRHRKHRPGE